MRLPHLLILAGLISGVLAAFLVAVPLGLAACSGSLIFVGWASLPHPKE